MPVVTAPASLAVPNLAAPAVDASTGLWTQSWRAFFRQFGAGAPPLQAVTVGASPLTFTAPGPGDLVLSGGAGLSAQLVRARASVAVPGGVVPMALGDDAVVFFTGAPEATFIPRTV